MQVCCCTSHLEHETMRCQTIVNLQCGLTQSDNNTPHGYRGGKLHVSRWHICCWVPKAPR